MKTELLEKLKAAKSKEEVADLISDAKKTDEVKALSPEDLDDVAGGTGEEEFDWKGMLITVYDHFGPAVTYNVLRDSFGVSDKVIDNAKNSNMPERDAFIFILDALFGA